MPVERMRITGDGETFVLDVSEREIDKAPTLDQLKSVNFKQWAERVDTWWLHSHASPQSGQ